MSAGSTIGFGVVFLLVCGGLSLIGAAALPLFARRGAAVERRAAQLAAAVPVVLGLGLVAILVVESLLAVDHCGDHGHHAHLCLAHGEIWFERGWAVALAATGGAVIATRLVLLAIAIVRGHLVTRRLVRVAQSEGDLRVVASERAFSFVAGSRRPAIFVSTGARAVLDADELAAVIAHERAHIAHADLRARIALDGLLAFAAPLVGIAIRDRWMHATERLRDAEAAAVVGCGATVASALVKLARAGRAVPALLPAFTPDGTQSLDARVEALLMPTPEGADGARAITAIACVALVLAFAAGAIWADPLHHALETLLG